MLSASAESLQITSDSPIPAGTFVNFNVTLFDDGKIAPNKKYEFSYEFYGATKEIETNSPSVQFQIPADKLEHGRYKVTFVAKVYVIFVYYELAEAKAYFEVTNRFTGDMELVQENDTVRENGFVSSQSETLHNIVISDKDKKLYEQAVYTRAYWFVDCLYMGRF